MSISETLKKYTEKSPGCWLWTGYAKQGYGIIRKMEKGRTFDVRAHYAAYELVHGKVPPGARIIHSCDNTICVNPSHLALRTENEVIKYFFRKYVQKGPDCWVWTGRRLPLSTGRNKGKPGYGLIITRIGGIFKINVLAHRAAWELVHGKIPDDMCVCHKCDNPPCVNIEHLFLGTRRENIEDAVKKGRQSKGEQHGLSKLTELQVAEIRKNYKRFSHKDFRRIPQEDRPFTQTGMAEKYGVCLATIQSVLNNITWKHVSL